MKSKYKLSAMQYRTFSAIGMGVRPIGKGNVIIPDEEAIEQLWDWSRENQLY